MKILATTTYFHPYLSGLSLYVKRLSEALSEKDDVTVLTMQYDRTLPQKETVSGVRIVRARPFVFIHKGILSWDFIRRAWKNAQRHDVILVHLPEAEGWIAALFGKFRGKRVISLYHCEVVLPEGFFNSIVTTFLELSNMAALLLSETVVTYTEDFFKHSRLLSYVREKVVCILPLVPKPGHDPAATKTWRKYVKRHTVIIGVAARLAAEKGIEYLLEAVPSIEKQLGMRSRILVAGPMAPVGEASYKRRIMKLVNAHKDRVVFLGEVSPNHMGSFYESIDLLVLPSINSTESFGMVQVEAMQYGVPVVASDLPGVRVPIRETRMGLLVPPRDAKAIAYAVCTIYKHIGDFKNRQSKLSSFCRPEKTMASWNEVLHP